MAVAGQGVNPELEQRRNDLLKRRQLPKINK
jgi:hypothetical protein